MIVESLLSLIDRGRTGKNWGFGIGLPKLEEIIDGVTQSTYTLIFSPTGSGKSSLLLYSYIYRPIMENMGNDKFKVTYFSLEMKAEDIFAKLLGMYIFEKYHKIIPTKKLFSKQKNYVLDDESYQIVLECVPWLNYVESIITIYDKTLNADIMYSVLMKDLNTLGTFTDLGNRKIYTPDNPDLIHIAVIDHMSLARPAVGRSLKEEIDLMSAYLVSLKNRCGISPVVVMQTNRDSGSVARRQEGLTNLKLTDTKDSGNPSQEAEVVISLFNPHREKLANYRGYDIKALQSNFRVITCLKNRYGIADVEIGCAFYGEVSWFAEIPRPEQIKSYEMYKTPDWIFKPKEESKFIL